MVLKNRWDLKRKLIAIISFSLFLQILICYPLWLNDFRSYPKLPFFESFEFSFINNLDYFLFAILLGNFILLLFGIVSRYLTALFFASFLLLILNDINRLQVWDYQLFAMLFVLLFTNKHQSKLTIKTLQIIMVCVYVWGGIQKLNIYFIEDVFPWFLEPFGLENYLKDHHVLAYCIALLELLIGIGLIFKKTRQIVFYAAVAMHVFILIILSPIGHNWNQVVWPWNICMIGLLYLLFYKKNNAIFENPIAETRSFLPFSIILLFFGIMPIFNFFDAWDEQLSFKMYSGISPEGIFYYQNQRVSCIPSDIKEKFVHVTPSSKKQRIILDDWAFYDLKVVPYKSKKRILQLGKKLCQCVEKPELAGLELLEVERWDKKKDSFIKHSCLELLQIEK